MSQQLDPTTNLPEEKKDFDFSQLKFNKQSPIDNQRAYSQNNDYLSGVDPNVSGDIEKQQISDNQSGMEAFGNTVGRLAANIAPEIIKGFAYLEDVVTGTPDGNAITDSMNNWINSVNEELPLYSSPNNKIINWENMSGLVNSMASFAVTGMGIGSVFGLLGGAGRIGSALGQLGTATALTGIEGAMEANELMKNSYVQEANRLYVENINKGLDPQLAKHNADIVAKQNVESAARTAMFTNYINVALNLTSAGYFIKGNPLDDIGRMVKNPANFVSKTTGSNFLKEGTQEALEEGVNVFAGATGKTQLKGQKLTFDNIWKNVDKDELKTSMILGAIGGIGQTAISTGIANLDTKWYTGKNVELRKKYAEQKDFVDNLTKMYNNPQDYSQPILDITHNVAMLKQAQDYEDVGNIEEAQKIRSLTAAYQAYRAFENGTWKDVKDVFSQLANNENLSEDQKANAKTLASDMDSFQKIYQKHGTLLNNKNPNRFALYSNRVEHYYLEKENRKLTEEKSVLNREFNDLINQTNELENLSEEQKKEQVKAITKSFAPRINENAKQIRDVVLKANELTKDFNTKINDNIDDLNLPETAKKLVGKQLTIKEDLLFTAKTDEEFNKALNRFDDNTDLRDSLVEEAASRQITNTKIKTIDANSIASSLNERWRDKPALKALEKKQLSEKLGVNPNASIFELAQAAISQKDVVKEYFDDKNKFVDNQLIEELNKVLVDLETPTTSAEKTDTVIPEIPKGDTEASSYDNVTILHDRGNVKYDPAFQEGIDLINSGEILNATVHFEVTKENMNSIGSNFKGSNTKVNNDNFTVLVVHYKDGNTNNKTKGNRIVVSKLRSNEWKNSKTNKFERLSDSLLRVRDEIKKQYNNEDIFTLPVSTKVQNILIGKVTTETRLINPVDIMKTGEKLILAVGVNKNGIVELDSNWETIGIKSEDVIYNRSKTKNGGVYMLVKLPNGKYIANLLHVKRNSELSQERKDKIKELIDEIQKDGANIVNLRNELNKFGIAKFNYDTKTKTFLVPRRLVNNKIVRLKEVDRINGDQLFDLMMAQVAQVSLKSINRGSYNLQLANNNVISTNLSVNRFNGNNIQLEYPKWGEVKPAPTPVTPTVTSSSPSNISNAQGANDLETNDEQNNFVIEEGLDDFSGAPAFQINQSPEQPKTDASENKESTSNTIDDLIKRGEEMHSKMPFSQKNVNTENSRIIIDYFADLLGIPRWQGDINKDDWYTWLQQTTNEIDSKIGYRITTMMNNPKMAVAAIVDFAKKKKVVDEKYNNQKENTTSDTTPVNTEAKVESTNDNIKKVGSSKKTFGKRSIGKSKSNRWNKSKELRRLSEILPGSINDKTKVVNEIERIGDLTTYGIFADSAITIIENAIAGTAYHEAVHAVVEILLTNKEKADLLKELSETFKPSGDRLSFLSELYPNLNRDEIYELALEEELADRFAEFAINRDSIRKEGKEVRNLFERILYWVKNIFNIIGNKNKVDRFFNNLYDGKFNNVKVYAKSQNNNFGKRSISKDPIQKYNRLENLKYLYSELMDELSSINPEMKDIEIINSYGFDNIIKAIVTRVITDRNAAEDQEESEFFTAEEKQSVINKYNFFINNLIDPSTLSTIEDDRFGNLNFFQIDEYNDTIINAELSANNPLMLSFFTWLETMGISVKMKDITLEKNSYALENPEEEDLDLVEENEETEEGKTLENWQFEANTISSEKSFSAELKRILSTIKKDETDDLYYDKFEDYVIIRNFLFENISDTYDVNEMMNKLADFQTYKPFAATIYNRALQDKSFKSDLFIYLASKHDADFVKLIKDEDNNVRVIKANRTNISMVIQEDIKTQFKNSKVLNKQGNIIKEEATRLNDKVKELVKLLLNNNNYIHKVYDEEDNHISILKEEHIETITNLFKDYSIDISKEQLTELANKGKGEILGLIRDEIGKVTEYLEQGKNVLTLSDESIQEGTLLEKLAKRLIPVTVHKSEKSMLNTNGKRVFTHGNSNFVKEWVANLSNRGKAFIEDYAKDPFFQHSFIIQELMDDTISTSSLEIVTLDGSSLIEGKNLTFDKMERTDLDLMTISAFHNQNRDFAYYRLGALSDAPQTGFLKYKKIKNAQHLDEFWDKVYMVALQEYSRMQFYKENETILSKVKNLGKRNNNYILSPYLNKNGKSLNINLHSPEGKKEVIERAKEYYAEEFQKEIERLTSLGILSKFSDGSYNTLLSKDIFFKNNKFSDDLLMSNLSDYFYNTVLVNSQTISLFSGDPAYYKSNDDWQKRNKQIWSPSINLDTSRTNPTYLTISTDDTLVNTIEDESGKLTEFGNFLNSVFENHPLKDDIVDKFRSNNLTDAASFVTINRYKEIMNGLNRWTKKHERIFKKINAGKIISNQDIDFIYADHFATFSALKPFDFHHNKKMVVDGKELNVIYPYQVKRAELPLFAQVIEGYKNKEKPQLLKLLDKMHAIEKRTGKNVAFNFGSAVKDGSHNEYKNIDELLAVPDDITNTIELDNSGYGLQVEVPEHYLDSENNFGSQIMKLIQADISPNTIFTSREIPNIEKLTGKKEATFSEIQDLYQELIAINIRSDYNKLKGKMSNVKALKKLLFKTAMQNKLPETYFETLGNLNDDHFPLPTWFPGWGKKNEQVLHSKLRNEVVKQKFPGASLVNVSSVGRANDLKVVYDSDNKTIKHFEARLPYWTRKHYQEFLNEDGNIDIDKVKDKLGKEKFEEIFGLVAYRIPTEHKHSMFKIVVVGFTHPLQGGAIELPAEATTISGFDFDIDKLYCMFPALNKKSLRDGNLERVEYDSETLLDLKTSNEERQNAILDIIKGILSTTEGTAQTLEPSSFDDIKVNAHRIYLLEKGYDSFKMSDKEVSDLIKSESLDICLPATQSEYIERNRVGKALIGFFANHNTCHAFAQQTNLEAIKPAKFNNVKKTLLNQMYNINNRLISKVLAGFLAASTDNAKDPIASFMNLNIFTVDTYAYLIRLGYDPKTIQLFISQDVIKQFEKELPLSFNNIETAFAKVVDNFNKEFLSDDMISADYIEGNIYNFTDEELIKHIKNTKEFKEATDNYKLMLKDPNISKDVKERKRKEYLVEWGNHAKRDFYIIKTFVNYQSISSQLGDLSTAIKVDTTNNRSTLSDVEVLQDKFLSLSGFPSLKNSSEFLINPILSSYYDNTIDSAKDLFKNFFPWLNVGFKKVKNDIQTNKGNLLTAKESEKINYMLLTYLGSGYEYFSNENKEPLSQGLPVLISKYISENKDIKDNPYVLFLNRFVERDRPIKVKTNRSTAREEEQEEEGFKLVPTITVLEFYRQGLNNIERQQLSSIWEKMLNEPKGTQENKIANFLVKYAFLRSGFTVGSMSFLDLVPPSFYINLTDSNGKNFVEYLQEKVEETNTWTSEEINDFTRMFLQNDYHSPRLMKTINKSSISFSTGDKVVLDTEKLTYLLTSKDKSINFVDRLPKYVLFEDNIMELNPNPVGENMIEYVKISKRGLKNYFVEMDNKPSLEILRSINNNIVPQFTEVENTFDIKVEEPVINDEDFYNDYESEDSFVAEDEVMDDLFGISQPKEDVKKDSENNAPQLDLFSNTDSFNLEIMDWFINNFNNLSEKQLDELKEMGVNKVDEIRTLNLNDDLKFGMLNKIKCL